MLESRRAKVGFAADLVRTTSAAAGWSMTAPWSMDFTAGRWKRFLSLVSRTDTRSGCELIVKLASIPKR
jgi:hypothetical protein